MNETRISRIASLIVAKSDTIKVGDDAKKVAVFLDNNPNPADKDFHKWAEGKGFDVDVMESAAYELATLFSSFLLYGRANEKNISAQDVDEKELEMGIKVEMEHTKDKSIAERIALDHLAEAPADAPLKYYTGLKLLEAIIERISKMDKKVASEKISEFKHFVDGLRSVVEDGKFNLGRYDDLVNISFSARGDVKSEILKFLEQLRFNGQIGHSFNIQVDEKGSENYKTYGFDGDGADRIFDIKVNGVSVPRGFGIE